MSRREKSNDGRQKVLIIGAGAAGMSCAATLAKAPNKFNVTLLEKGSTTGGVAGSIPLDPETYRADWLNSGVQGGSSAFRHTYNFFREYGYEPKECMLQLAFGKGKENFWTNTFPTYLVDEHAKDIQKFGKALKVIKLVGPLLWILPLKNFVRLFRFSKDFTYKMLYPLASLLLGTGNEIVNVPCGLLYRLFANPQTKVWDFDAESFVPTRPRIFTFPNMGQFYKDWTAGLRAKGVTIRLNTQAVRIVQRDKKGIAVETQLNDLDRRIDDHECGDAGVTQLFDKLVLCVPCDEASRLLGQMATWKERVVFGGVEYFDDLTVTHSDSAYFQRLYEMSYRDELCAKPRTSEQEEQVDFARGGPDRESGYKPMYCTYPYPHRRDKMEAAFDCTNLQHQFQPDQRKGEPPIPPDRHIFQSHFMNERLKHYWTIDQIDEDKIIERKWWHQLSLRWQQYARVVPMIPFINGKNNTFFAGSWTFVNLYEMASVSGIAAAYRLGAPYERFDDVAESYFAMILFILHGVRFSRSGR